jgi:hypothetical protein
MEKFFPQLGTADFNNIIGEILATCLRVDSNITTEEMARTISRLLNNTVLGLNKIPNKALKTYRPLITPWLADVTRAYFIISYYLRFRKAMIIVVLYKKNKVDYLFLGSY